jgi:hypothetical protein
MPNSTQTSSGGFSTTARLSVADAAEIDDFVQNGYFPSRSRFVIEAIRDAAIEIDRDLNAIYGVIVNDDSELIDTLATAIVALQKKYLEKTNYNTLKKEKPVVQVNITGDYTFMNYCIDTIKDKLRLKDLQEAVSFAVFLKLTDMREVKSVILSLTEYNKKLNENELAKMPADKAEQILIKAGIIRPE